LTPHAFTSGRIAVLELLASQAAISLENAVLYPICAQRSFPGRRAEDEPHGSWAGMFHGKLVWSENIIDLWLRPGGGAWTNFPIVFGKIIQRIDHLSAKPRSGHSR